MKFVGGIGKFTKFFGKLFLPLTIAITAFEGIKGMIKGFEKEGFIGGVKGLTKGLFKGLIGDFLNFIKDGFAWFSRQLGFERFAKILDSFDFNEVWSKTIDLIYSLPKTIHTWVKNLIGKFSYELTHPGKRWEDSSEYKKSITQTKQRIQNSALDRDTNEPLVVKKREDKKLTLTESMVALLEDISDKIASNVIEPIAKGFGITESWGDPTSSNRSSTKYDYRKNQQSVYNAFRKVGFSDSQAKYITAEVGRENAYNPDYMFGSHKDPANNYLNSGFLSWQKGRQTKLDKFMARKGLLISTGKYKPGQASLDAMAEFTMLEMKNNSEYSRKFLQNPNLSPKAARSFLKNDYLVYGPGQERAEQIYNQMPAFLSDPRYGGNLQSGAYINRGLQKGQEALSIARLQQSGGTRSIVAPVTTTNLQTVNNSNLAVIANIPAYRNTLDDQRLRAINGDFAYAV
jgi:hypothetical protein